MGNESKCPFSGGSASRVDKGATNQTWWPEQLNLNIIRQHSSQSNPMGEGFGYAKAFK